jgi:hypothetical protein
MKIGDRVRIIKGHFANGEPYIASNGKKGTIIGKSLDVEFDWEVGFDWEVEYDHNRELILSANFSEDELELIHLNEDTPTKPTNPKDALGIKKAPLSTLPTGPIYEVALAMLEGARKYGRHNYRVMGVKASVYYDAAMGHLTSWWEGEDIDPESGLHHLAKAMACLAVVRDSMMMENWIDDRPPRYPNNPSKLMRNNPAINEIIDKYPNCKEPFTEKNKDANS